MYLFGLFFLFHQLQCICIAPSSRENPASKIFNNKFCEPFQNRFLQYGVEFGNVEKHGDDEQQADEADNVLRLCRVGTAALIVAVTEGALDVRARYVRAVFLFFFDGTVHFAEPLFQFFFLLVIVNRLVVEHSVFLFAEHIENSHKYDVLVQKTKLRIISVLLWKSYVV